MAKQLSSFLTRSLAFLAVGCAAMTVGCAAPQSKAAAEPPQTFRAPSEIRPELSVKPIPTDPAPAPPSQVAVAKARGESAWVPFAQPRAWRYIVIHHSATPDGNAAKFDREHKAKGWDELGYHFVIDNGNGGPDGRVEVGPRWPKQKWGAHAKTPDNRYNEQGIGICFVGNFQNSRPTTKQLQSAAHLVAWLMQRYDIPASNVIGHDDTKSTLCPGKNMSLAQVRFMANQVLAGVSLDVDDTSPVNARIAASKADRELLKNQ